MKANVFARLEISKSSGYISINKVFFEKELHEEYEGMVTTMKEFGHNRWETIEGYELMFILVNVSYDGRKKRVTEEDILKSLEKANLAEKIGSSMFGGFYKPTEELETLLKNRLNKRKLLAGVA